MRPEYDLSRVKRVSSTRRSKQRVTFRLDQPTVEYFKQLAAETGMPYQTLINLYLRDCADSKRALRMEWRPRPGSPK